MPIYTYKCKKCGSKFERLEGVISETEELKCPDCGSKKAEKVFSTFSIGKGKSVSPACEAGTSSCSGCPGGTCGLG